MQGKGIEIIQRKRRKRRQDQLAGQLEEREEKQKEYFARQCCLKGFMGQSHGLTDQNQIESIQHSTKCCGASQLIASHRCQSIQQLYSTNKHQDSSQAPSPKAHSDQPTPTLPAHNCGSISQLKDDWQFEYPQIQQ